MSATGAELVRYLRTLAVGRANDAFTDRQLLDRFVTRREEASFAALVRRYGPMVLGVCRRILGHDQDAEDAFQATFFVLAKNAAAIRKHESLGSWLHGVAFHIAEKLRGKRARRAAQERKAVGRPCADPADDVAWREIRCLLDSELSRLPERYRGPLVLCYLQGKTQDEAARQLDWPLRTFRRRLKCARELLVLRLTRRGVTLSAALSAPLLADATAHASLPPLLAANTVRAGLASATGQATGTLVSAQVAALVEGGTCSLLAKKASIALVLLVSLTLGIGSLLAHRAVHSHTLAEAPATPKAAPPAKVTPHRPPAALAEKDKHSEIKGRVLDPDGKPLAGAKVYVSTYTYKDKRDPKVRAETDANGRFRFMANHIEVDQDEMVAAVAPGYGPDWAALKEVGNGKELTLRLVKDDVPIKGRVLDLEGHPIADATIRLVRVQKMPGEDLTPYLKALQAKSKDRNAVAEVEFRHERIMTDVWGILGSPKFVKTGADGRFELRGFGRERIVYLRIEGPGIEYRNGTVMTRSVPVNALPPDMHGAAFDHLAAPSKPIRGTVREKGTGKPVAGVYVNCDGEPAITDKEGHYEIPGVRKSSQYFVGVSGTPIIFYHKEVGDTLGLEPITVNFEVERGLLVRLRITEKGTGKPLPGLIQYVVRKDNPHLSRYTTYEKNSVSWPHTEKNGSIEFVALPGPAYVAVRADDERFTRARLPGKEKERFAYGVMNLGLDLFHAVIAINPSAEDAKSLSYDVALDPGRVLPGNIAGPDGRLLAGVMAAGLRSVVSLVLPSDPAEKLPAHFTATGLEPAHPRALVFFHAEKKLAKTVVIGGDEKTPLTVRLEPLGAVTGRLIDAAGKPRAGVTVGLGFSNNQYDLLPADLTMTPQTPLHKAVIDPQAATDKDGRFRIDGLVAGMKYGLYVRAAGQHVERLAEDVAGKPGATVDLGEIKTREIPEKGSKEKPKP